MSYDNNIMSVPTPVSPNQTKLSYQKLLELADDFGDQLKENWTTEFVLPVIPVKYPNTYVADVLPSDAMTFANILMANSLMLKVFIFQLLITHPHRQTIL